MSYNYQEMLDLEKYVLGELDTNCYLIWDEQSLDAVMVDPADQGDFLSEEILRLGLNLKAALLTHGHFDHVLGLLPLKLNFQMPIWLHQDDQFLLIRAADSAAHWTGKRPDPVPLADQLYSKADFQQKQDSSQFMQTIGSLIFQVLPLPGHTPGSVAYIFQDEKWIFSGDVIFADGVGRTDFTYAKTMQLHQSIDFLKKNYSGWEIYGGHGEMFYV